MNIANSAERRAIFATEGGHGKGPTPLTHGRLLIGSAPTVHPFPTPTKVRPNVVPTQISPVPGIQQAGAPLQNHIQTQGPLAFGGQYRRVRL